MNNITFISYFSLFKFAVKSIIYAKLYIFSKRVTYKYYSCE